VERRENAAPPLSSDYDSSVRIVVAVLVAASALAVAPLASATLFPPVGSWKLVHVTKPTALHIVRSCNAQSKSRTPVATTSRRLHPVACEQPPRSKALDGNFVITFGP
jgi:hypothetical protein